MSNIQKVFSQYLFRVMSTWFGVYIKQKISSALIEPMQQAVAMAQAAQGSMVIVNVGSQTNVEEIVNWFRDNEGEQTSVTQQWYGETEPTEHTVYRNIIYIGGDTV